jgi:hypothetical protein
MDVGFGFAVTDIVKEMVEKFEITPGKARDILRTESTFIANNARAASYEDRDPEGKFKYIWVGPNDHRTTFYSDFVKKQVRDLGKGNGVSLDVLKELTRKAAEMFVQDTKIKGWTYRDFVTHINQRHIFVRKV